jgi:O-antigen biosynthesis protein
VFSTPTTHFTQKEPSPSRSVYFQLIYAESIYLKSGRVQERELKYIEHSKVTVVVSDLETKEIRKFLPSPTIVRISNIHADLDTEVTPLPFEARSGCVFVGNWNHLPNRDAVLWFAHEILPLVHPHVDDTFVFHVIGANNMPPEIAKLNNTRFDGTLRVIVHG